MNIAVTRGALVLPLFVPTAALSSGALWVITESASAPDPEPPPPSPPSPPAAYVSPYSGGGGPPAAPRRAPAPETTALAVPEPERIAAHGVARGVSEIVAVEIALVLRRKR